MKLTKENVYIDLIGKTNDELTELYNFLKSIGEKQFLLLNELINEYDFWDYFLWDRFGQWTLSAKKGSRKEVTIEQLKEILKPMEKEFYLSMCRIIVDNAEQSKKLQELALKQGFTWSDKSKEIKHTNMNVLYFNSEDYTITYSDLSFDDSNFKTFHFTDVFKETLEQQLQKAEEEVKRLKEAIEDSKLK